MIEDKDVRLRVWLLDGGEVAWLKIVDGCVCCRKYGGVVQIVVGVVGKM